MRWEKATRATIGAGLGEHSHLRHSQMPYHFDELKMNDLFNVGALPFQNFAQLSPFVSWKGYGARCEAQSFQRFPSRFTTAPVNRLGARPQTRKVKQGRRAGCRSPANNQFLRNQALAADAV